MMGMLEIAQESSLRLAYSSSEGTEGPPVRMSGIRARALLESTTYGEAQ